MRSGLATMIAIALAREVATKFATLKFFSPNGPWFLPPVPDQPQPRGARPAAGCSDRADGTAIDGIIAPVV